MKKIILLTLLSFTMLSAFSQQPTNKKLNSFCNKFSKAVMSGSPEKCLKFFDEDYVKAQHDGFLEGETEQFLSEFLLVNSIFLNEDSEGVLPAFSDISDIKFIDIITNAEGEKAALFEITLKKGCKFSMHAHIRILNKNEFGFYGAMG